MINQFRKYWVLKILTGSIVLFFIPILIYGANANDTIITIGGTGQGGYSGEGGPGGDG